MINCLTFDSAFDYSNSSLICFTNVFELCYLVFKSLIVLFKLPILNEIYDVILLAVMLTPLMENVLAMSSSGFAVSASARSNPFISTYTSSYPMPISKKAVSWCMSFNDYPLINTPNIRASNTVTPIVNRPVNTIDTRECTRLY